MIKNHEELKHRTSTLYALCAKLFPQEFNKIFLASRTEFRDWLNKKTSLNMDHVIDRNNAIEAWIEALENMRKY